MTANPLAGVLLHWLGGLASGSFYVPYRFVRGWSWEIYWLTGGFFSWLVAPWLLAFLTTDDLVRVLAGTPTLTLLTCYGFGALWGLGGLTFGLAMRYLGMSLGMGIALGYCAVFGTLVPPAVRGELLSAILPSHAGRVVLGGVAVTAAGIALAVLAGRAKERHATAPAGHAAIPEFAFHRGLGVATFSGLMSSCFSYGLAAGEPIRVAALAHGTAPLWQGLPVLVVVLLGGFSTNLVWCLALIVRHHSGRQILGATAAAGGDGLDRPPLARNYALCAAAGVTWYLQFFFYTMGETKMGAYRFSSWTLHMASIIVFSTLWGLVLGEWRGAATRSRTLLLAGLGLLVGATALVGYGTYLGTSPGRP